MGSQAERCSLSSSFPLLPSHGVQLPGSRLSGKYQQTVSSQILGQVLALAAISTPGHRNAMLLRSGATLATTTTTHAGTETTVSSRSTSGTGALVCATCPAIGTLRTAATWALIRTGAGWATGARTRAWEAALHPWEDQRLLLVRTSAPTCPGLRSVAPAR